MDTRSEAATPRSGKVLYAARVHTTGGRDGASRCNDGRLDIKHSSPGTPGNG
jgi:lipoyl-dependent peroxiredoxin